MFESVRISLEWTNLRKRSKQSHSTQTAPIAHRLTHVPQDVCDDLAIKILSTETRSRGSEGSFVRECLTLHLSSLHKLEHSCKQHISECTLRRLISIAPTSESKLYETESRRTRLFENEIEYALHEFVYSLDSCFRASCLVDPTLRSKILRE